MLERRERQALEMVAFVQQQPHKALDDQQLRALHPECNMPSPWYPNPSGMPDAALFSEPNIQTEGTREIPEFDPINMEEPSIYHSFMATLFEDDSASISASPFTTNLATGFSTAASSTYSVTTADASLDTSDFGKMTPDCCMPLPNDVGRERVGDDFQYSTMMLEDLEPEIVRKVISVLLESRASVKIRLSTTSRCGPQRGQGSKIDGYPREHIVGDSQDSWLSFSTSMGGLAAEANYLSPWQSWSVD